MIIRRQQYRCRPSASSASLRCVEQSHEASGHVVSQTCGVKANRAAHRVLLLQTKAAAAGGGATHPSE